jgi:phage protein D
MGVSLASRNILAAIQVGAKTAICESLEVSLSKQQNSDSCHAELPLNAIDGFGQAIDLAFWDSLTSDSELVAVFDGVPVFWGSPDNVAVDFAAGIISVSGRDKSKGPIEKKSTESFKNKTRAQVVQEIAGRHGLEFVGTGSMDKAGKQQQIDWNHITDEVSDWSTVQRLADEDGKVAFVSNGKLFYSDPDDTTTGVLPLFYVPQTAASAAQSNFLSCTIHRNLQAGRPHQVNVHSHHTKKNETYHERANVGGNGAILTYDYEHAELQKGQGQKIAQKRLREHVRHELTVDCDIVGNPLVLPTWQLALTGFGPWSQSYFIDEVHHRARRDFTTSITARNTKKGRGGAGGGGGGGGGSGDAGGGAASVGGDQFNFSENGAINSGRN